jgi:hypothetical protein
MWIDKWMDGAPDPDDKWSMRMDLLKKAFTAGDTIARITSFANLLRHLQPADMINSFADNFLEEESETKRFKYMEQLFEEMKSTGRDLLKNERLVTCGHCSLVCGQDVKEVSKRYKTLCEGGYVVNGPNKEVIVVDTYEEYMEQRDKYTPEIPKIDMAKDIALQTVWFPKNFMGVDVRGSVNGYFYNRKLQKAIGEKITGHAEAMN